MVRDSFVIQNEQVISIPAWTKADPALSVGFTTRNGGVSESPYQSFNLGLHVGDKEPDVIQNRIKLAALLHFPLENWVVGEQIHGSKVQSITKLDKGAGTLSLNTAIQGVDGIYTRETDILLTSLYADCVPLYFFSPKHRLVGLAHAGWRGTVGGIAQNMIRHWMTDEGVPADEIQAAIGPAISQHCYEVDEYVLEKVTQITNETDFFQETTKGHYLLDLRKLNKLLLLQAGILEQNIITSNYCTGTNSDLFFSHRIEGGRTGRMMSFIGRKEGESRFDSER